MDQQDSKEVLVLQKREDEIMRILPRLVVPRQRDSTGLLFLKLFFGKLVIPAVGAFAILYALYAVVMLLS